MIGDDLDVYAPVASLREVELACELWGLGLEQVDFTEVGDLLASRGPRAARSRRG